MIYSSVFHMSDILVGLGPSIYVKNCYEALAILKLVLFGQSTFIGSL